MDAALLCESYFSHFLIAFSSQVLKGVNKKFTLFLTGFASSIWNFLDKTSQK